MPRSCRPLRGLAIGLLALAGGAAAARAADVGARSFKSGPIQITADGRTVWVANPDNDSVSRLDTASRTVVEIPLPAGLHHEPLALSVKEDGSEVWAACRDSDRVFVLRGADGGLLETIDLPWGSGPSAIALSPDQRTALVTLLRLPGMAVLDVPSHSVRQVLPWVHFFAPVGVAWTDDGVSAWVTHALSVEMGGDPFLSRVELAADGLRLTTKQRTLSSSPQNSASLAAPHQVPEGGYLNYRGSLAQVPPVSGKREMWVPTQYEDEHPDVFTPDSTVQAVLRHLDLASRTLPNTNNDKVILTAVDVHDPNTGCPNCNYVGPGWNVRVAGLVDIAFTADGRMAFVVGEQSNNVVVVPTVTPAANLTAAPPLATLTVGARPIGIAMSPVADVAYVANRLTRDVSVLDLAAGSELARVPATPVTGEPFTPSVLQGARIFHSSVDPAGLGRISSSGKVACASCHPNGESDGRTWSLGPLPGSHGPRGTMSLLGIARTFTPGQRDPRNGQWGELHRSGDRDEIQDFEHTFQGPLMGGTGFLGAAANPDLGPPNAGLDPDLDALADYVMSLPAPPRSPFRTSTGALSESAIRGAASFMGVNHAVHPLDAGCAQCHVPGTGFVDFTSHDVGEARNGGENELNNRNPAWTVNTATLLGIWASPPYVGVTSGANDLVDVIKDQAGQALHGTPQAFTGRQIQDLADFVGSIDGSMTEAEVLAARDTTPPRIVRVEPVSLTMVDVWFSETVNPGSANAVAGYSLVDAATGQAVPVTAAQRDAQNGDLVRLTTQIPAACATYRLAPAAGSGIRDVADRATNGVANVIDPADPANTHEFSIGPTLTVTLGASGYESLTVPVHDVATLTGSDWEHDCVWLWGANRGFVRLDWSAIFAAATGVASSADILDASFSLDGDWGDVQPVELRRVLGSWSDPAAGGDWNSNPVGGPTWNWRVYPNVAWNQPNAGARTAGVEGRNVGDYDATNDLAFTPDLVMTPTTLGGRTTFASPGILDAFRFWFDHPTVDYGYAFELSAGAAGKSDLRFRRSEDQLREHGPVLTITYSLPIAAPAPVPEVSAPGAPPLFVTKAAAGSVSLSFQDLGAGLTYNVYEGAIGRWYSHQSVACGQSPALAAGRRELVYAPGTGNRYIEVTAANGCVEGPASAGIPASTLDCVP